MIVVTCVRAFRAFACSLLITLYCVAKTRPLSTYALRVYSTADIQLQHDTAIESSLVSYSHIT